ncbi:MAG: flagellar biosynthesis regulator FlaF [Pseudomonadota bacterium]
MNSNGYAEMQRETLSGRALEREVFTRITARLEAADIKQPGGATALATALGENKRLWITLAIDLANPQNTCPDEIAAGLISLAAFVESHTRAVIDGKASQSILVEINKNIIKGLTSEEAEAA